MCVEVFGLVVLVIPSTRNHLGREEVSRRSWDPDLQSPTLNAAAVELRNLGKTGLEKDQAVYSMFHQG